MVACYVPWNDNAGEECGIRFGVTVGAMYDRYSHAMFACYAPWNDNAGEECGIRFGVTVGAVGEVEVGGLEEEAVYHREHK
ncbi:hypothetical protein NDU88_004277 [Pleurodeles waltl]|uniref:Uncharacterized protein n=1 Tax=Pleurodeles waltl TaxID=8319 RepID=A0AAV7SIB2_PLEWA|nr:hypothetical protein NDU88_004277 [Pleurodeles waltl]